MFFPVQNNAAQIEAMRSGRLHIAGFNTGSNPLAVNCAGFSPFTIMASLDGTFGYEMEIITYPGSGIEKMKDIKGRELAFTSPTSYSGFKAPSAILKANYGLLPDVDFEPVFSGKHDNSVLGVANKHYDAAAIANSVMGRMFERGVVQRDQIVSLYKSQTFPTTGYGVAYNLKPELQDKIRNAFATFVWEPTASLDPKTSRQIMRLICELCAERGLTAIINIHDVALAQMFVQRVIGLRAGAVEFDGPPDGLTPDVLTTIWPSQPRSWASRFRSPSRWARRAMWRPCRSI